MSSVFFMIPSLWGKLVAFFSEVPEQYPSIEHVVEASEREEKELKAYYDSVKDPEVLFRVFYARVAIFGWGMREALIANNKIRTVEAYGYNYELKEFYDCSKTPAVTYIAFYNRVALRNWDPTKAVREPNLY